MLPVRNCKSVIHTGGEKMTLNNTSGSYSKVIHTTLWYLSHISARCWSSKHYFSIDNEMFCTYGFQFCDNIIKLHVVYLHQGKGNQGTVKVSLWSYFGFSCQL